MQETRSGGYEGIGFAIPSKMAERIYEEIKENGKVERGWIGIAIQDIDNAVMVIEVVSGSPAEISGIEKKDILINVNGKPLRDKSQLRNIVASSGINSPVEFFAISKAPILEYPAHMSVNIYSSNNDRKCRIKKSIAFRVPSLARTLS